jgi:hypothetical protein
MDTDHAHKDGYTVYSDMITISDGKMKTDTFTKWVKMVMPDTVMW